MVHNGLAGRQGCSGFKGFSGEVLSSYASKRCHHMRQVTSCLMPPRAPPCTRTCGRGCHRPLERLGASSGTLASRSRRTLSISATISAASFAVATRSRSCFLRSCAVKPHSRCSDLVGETVQVGVAIDVQARQQLHQVEDIRDHRRVEARLRLIQTVHHVRDHVPEPLPQIFGSARQ